MRCGDGSSDAHGPAAAGADGDVDAEDAGQERHPGQAGRSSVAELSVEQGGDGGKLQLAARDEEGQLLGRGFGLVGTRHDGTAQLVVGRKHTVVLDGVGPRRGDKCTQPGEKSVGAHLGEGGSKAIGLLEAHPHLPVGGALYGIEGKGRAEEIAAHPLETLAVAPVDGDRGVQLHAEATDEHRRCWRRSAGRGSHGTQRKAELDAGHERFVHRLAIIAADLEVLGQVGVQPLQRPQEVLLAEALHRHERPRRPPPPAPRNSHR